MATTTSRTSTRALTLVGSLVLASSLFAVTAPTAGASTLAPSIAQRSALASAGSTPTAVQRPSFSARIIKTVASRKGSPYQYGASGPHRFDCSGLTMWTFRKLGRRLPHSSSAQYGRVKHIRASARRPGDLVFFHDGGGIYHVAIYAGHNRIWHAPYSGTRVRLERLWTRSVYYGRIG